MPDTAPRGDFDGLTAVVTGGGNGIGRACVTALAREGAHVVVVDRDADAARSAAEDAGGVAVTADVSLPEGVAAVAAALDHGGADVLVHSVGIQRYGDVVATDPATWEEVMRVNVTAAYLVSRALLPGLVERGGAIVFVGSVQSVGALSDSAAYVTSKHALWGLTQATAADYAGRVRVNCVAPGSVRTPLLAVSATHYGKDVAAAFEQWGALHPMGRIAEPEEVAEVVAFLASHRASFVTGSLYMVDGGMSAVLR